MPFAFRQTTKKQGNIASIHREGLTDRLAFQEFGGEARACDSSRATVRFVRASQNGLAFDLKPKESVRTASRIASLSETVSTFKGTRIARVQRVIENCGAEHSRKSL